MTPIMIRVDELEIPAALDENSVCAKKILDALPITARANRWGEEFYFDIGLAADLEPEARTEMAVGELGYWPTGQALCIFFGPTPASSGETPIAASEVNPVGRIEADALLISALRSKPEHCRIQIELKMTHHGDK